MTKIPAPGADLATDELYCLACDKAGHRTTECHSTHGINTPQARELHRLCCAASAAVPASEPDRLFMEHGLWHDRKTGQHMYTQDQYDEEGRACLAEGKQNAMPAAAPAPVSGMPDLAELQLYNIDEILRGDRTLKYVKFYKAADVERLLCPTGETK